MVEMRVEVSFYELSSRSAAFARGICFFIFKPNNQNRSLAPHIRMWFQQEQSRGIGMTSFPRYAYPRLLRFDFYTCVNQLRLGGASGGGVHELDRVASVGGEAQAGG